MVIRAVFHHSLGHQILCRIPERTTGDEFIQIGNLNTGQVLSIPFMIAGVIIMVISKKFKITQAENEKPE